MVTGEPTDEQRALMRAFDRIGQLPPKQPEPIRNELIDWLGVGLGLWWSFGGPAWSALGSIALDSASIPAEVEGILTALSLHRVEASVWTWPAGAIGEVVLRREGFKPPLGSLRSAVMLYGIIHEGYRSRSPSRQPKGA